MAASLARTGFQHVVITGASSGIGAALAKRYALDRPILSLLGRSQPRLETVTRQCVDAGAIALPEVGDVTDTAFMTDWLARCDTRAPVDLVIANAGIGGRFAMPAQGWETVDVGRQIFATNILGVSNSILPILPRLVDRRQGRLVLVSSLAGLLGLPQSPAYCASKAAIRIYGEALRRALAPHRVGVSVVYPGFVQTPMSATISDRLPFLWDSDKAAKYIVKRVARGKADIAFPWPLAALTRMAAMLPSSILDSILDRVSLDRGSL